MTAYLLPFRVWEKDSKIFQFDLVRESTMIAEYKASQYAIEEGAEISDHVVAQPKTWALSGLVTAALALTDGEVFSRVPDAHAALIAAADTRQPFGLVTGPEDDAWVAEVLITKVQAKKSRDTGQALDIEILCQEYRTVEYTEIEIPAELLAEEVKPSATPDKSTEGGSGATADATEETDPGSKTAAASLVDGDGPFSALGSLVDTFS